MAEFISGLNPLLALFLIAALGYLIGAIKIKGIELGTAGVLLVALVFGHFGCEMPALIRNVGLALFVTSVGFIAAALRASQCATGGDGRIFSMRGNNGRPWRNKARNWSGNGGKSPVVSMRRRCAR